MKTEQLHEPIGRLVVKFQFLEFLVNALLLELMPQEKDIGLCLTSEMAFSRLVSALVSVANLRLSHCPDFVNDVSELAAKLNDCECRRNTTIHSLYFEASGQLKRCKITAKQGKGLRKWMFDVTTTEIEDHISNVEQANKSLMGLVRKLKAAGIISNGFFK